VHCEEVEPVSAVASVPSEKPDDPPGSRRLDDGARPIVEVCNIQRHYGAVRAVGDANLAIYPSEVVAIVGDNGAGKSTLVRVMCGAERPDAGVLLIDGEPRVLHSTHDAARAGLSVVFQDLALVEQRSIAHNFFLGREPARLRLVDRKTMSREAASTMARLNVKMPALMTTLVSRLSGGQRQAVAVGRAIHQGGRLIFMDEPTAALGVQEQEQVLSLIERLKADGVAIVIVSHNLAHVYRVADRIVVMRGGRIVGIRSRAATTQEEIVRLIVGADATTIVSSYDAV
jgi:simple sugar transport system ATP-binding protein